MATTPYPFVSGTVLTASQLNSTFNIPTTTKTASHTLIAADAGTRVIMNSASATTITVNTSIFAASDVLEIQNIGAGVCTVTAGTATVVSAGPLAIPQNGGGRLVFSSASAATYFPTAVTTAAGGMTLLSTTTLSGASTTITISDFSYNYIFGQIAGMTNATANGAVTMKANNSATLFHGVEIFNGNGTAGTAASTDTTIGGATTSTRTDANNIWTFMIYNYASSTQYKNYFQVQGAQRAAGGDASSAAFGYLKTNSQISSLVLANSGGNWSTGTVTIYGVK